MARQPTAPVLGPTLPPEKSIPILEGLVADAEQLRQEPPNSAGRQEWTNTGEGALLAALGGASPAIDAYSLAQCGIYSPSDTRQYRLQQANDQLDGMIAAINSAVTQLRWRLPDASHVFLPAGSAHDAYVEIRKVMLIVAKELTVVDSYVDDTLWSLLKNVAAVATIRILTGQMKGDFALEGRKFMAQHGNKVEVRTNSSYHDRFILIDGAKCWHLGASIKDAGNKAFVMSEIVSPGIAAAVHTDVQTVWNTASVITL